MIFHFRRMDAGDGYLVCLEDFCGLEITILLDDGYRWHKRQSWGMAVKYERAV